MFRSDTSQEKQSTWEAVNLFAVSFSFSSLRPKRATCAPAPTKVSATA